MDAIELLKKDHQEVTKLFQRYSGSKDRRGAKGIVEKVCRELEVHALIEEEIFYPAIREADRQLADQVQEALQEHARVKQQVAALQRADEDVEGLMTTLQQDVEHHVTEEEGEMFPRVAEVLDERRRTELGRRLQARKRELQARKRELMGETDRPARRAAGKTRKAGGQRRASSRRGRRTRSTRRQAKAVGTKSRARKTTKKKAARGGRRR